MHVETLRTVGKHAGGAVLSVVLGIVGGAICGAAILSFGAFIGRSGNTGEDYFGYWNIATVWLGFLYGAPLGAMVAPVGYATLVRTSGIRRAIIPATLGTLAGGFVGSILAPPIAVVTGVVGFFVALILARNAA
jgi:hypothetical protein